MNGELGPRDIGSIISDTFRIYGRNFLKLAAIAAIVQVIIYILTVILLIPFFMSSVVGGGSDLVAYLILIYSVIVIIYLVVTIAASVLMEGALIQAVSEQSLERSIGIGRAYGFAWKRFGSMLGATFLILLALVGMSITVIGIPFAVYFGVRWSFIVQAALLEGVGPRAALSRSSAIVKGNWWRVLGIMLVVYIIASVISVVLAFIPVIGSIIGSILVTPIGITAAILLYYDLRFRESGYNKETLALELGVTSELTETTTM
jgi:hypothetical protein